MPKKAKELTALDVKRISKPGRHAVGVIPGLMLVVKPVTLSKSWILRIVIGNKRRNIGLGGYPEISLADARNRAREAKRLIEQGIDPIERKKAILDALRASQNGRMTFREAAYKCHEKKMSEFRNKKHGLNWINSVEKYAFPVIGNVAVEDVNLQHILDVLNPIWGTITETATRLRQRIEQIINWSIISGYRTADNPARWKGHLDAILPKPTKIKTVKHHKALLYKEIYPFMLELRNHSGISARALEFVILTACRSNEVRGATWEEVDFSERIWTVPAERMKAGKPHRVPLTDGMIQILNQLPRFEESPFIFTGPRGGSLSDMALSKLCKDMKVDAVPHGFRSTFRDWAAECTNYPREVCEQALAHTIASAVEAAYRRGDLFEKRRLLMTDWNLYVNRKPDESAKVIQIREAVK